MRFRDLA
jgi:two-component system cell cycle response regulator CpdR